MCLNAGSALLTATANGDANVPSGYSQAYVLTSGTGLVIEQLGGTPEFTVTGGGLYTIHSFVYPTGLDLSVVVPGVTTGFDVNGLLVQGGGDLCASLDVAGAQFNVSDCTDGCEASAGTLSASAPDCLVLDPVSVIATPNGDAIVPVGYETIYVLTQGGDLVIVDAGTNPEFMVTTGGLYTIHTLVYDPATLDLGIVQFGVTTGFDVNGLLIQGGGSICASLDVAGASYEVVKCETDCTADAGTIDPEDFIVCRSGGSATLFGIPGGNSFTPPGYQTLYVLTSGLGLTIQQVNAIPEFTVTQLGLYRIHTLVYDPSTLDLSIVQLGVTTGFDVNGLLIQGGGSICASLDVSGAPFLVVGPFLCWLLENHWIDNGGEVMSLVSQNGRTDIDDRFLQTVVNDVPLELTAWPNPAIDQLNVRLDMLQEGQVEFALFDITGKEVISKRRMLVGVGENLSMIDIGGLETGQYFLRVIMGDHMVTERISKTGR